MKKMFATLLTTFLVTFALSSPLANASVPAHKAKASHHTSKSKSRYTQSTHPIIVNSNAPEFTIRLKANPSTGYSWFMVDLNARIVRIVDSKYIAPAKILPGAPGVDEWTFRVLPEAFKVQHVTAIKMVYAQPWNLSKGQSKTFTVITHHCSPINKPHDKHAKVAAKKHGWIC